MSGIFIRLSLEDSQLEKVGECLYRYIPMGKCYGRFEVNGREVRHGLSTTDKPTAKRKLVNLQRALSRTTAGGDKLTLAALCDRYLETTRSQAAATVYRKEAIARRTKVDWPGGADVAISKVVTSQVVAWLASYGLGVPFYNLHLMFVRGAFGLAVADRLIAESPAAGRKIKKSKKVDPQDAEPRGVPSGGHRYIRGQPYNAEARAVMPLAQAACACASD